MKKSKRYKEIREKIEEKKYSITESLKKIKEAATAKFDESVDIAIVLGVNPKKSDQMVRGTVILPAGTGKNIKVAVVAEGKDVENAIAAGADIAGKDEIIDDIKKGKLEFDVLISTSDCMKDLAKLGRILGPRGLMPSPKSGTVVKNVADAVKKIKKGQIEFKMDKNGVIHSIIGKSSFSSEQLETNYNEFINSIKKSRPSSAKGKFIKKITLSSTMGPAINIAV